MLHSIAVATILNHPLLDSPETAMIPRIARLTVPLIVLVLSSASAFAQQPSQPQRFALLVGINEYDHDDLKKLQFAENDVLELGDVLKKGGYEVTQLTGRDANKKAIEEKLLAIVKSFPKNGTLIVAFAGHGLQFEGDSDNYFCPVDARPFKAKKDTLVSLKWVYERLQEDAAAGPKLVLVDACRNDPKSGRGRGLDSSNAPNPPRGVAVLMSCSPGETAWEHESLKHGVFFHHVIQGLKGDAKDVRREVTWDGLRGYVKREVAIGVPKLIGDGATQTPEENGRLAGLPPVLVELDPFNKELQAHFEARIRGGFPVPFLSRVAPDRIASWKRGAEDGFPAAQILYGCCVEQGLAVKSDPVEAAKWYRNAADNGEPYGWFLLGCMYADGAGFPKDDVEAVRHFQNGAKLGDTNCMCRLGQMSANGQGGLVKDEAESVRWYKKAADAGDYFANHNLAFAYDHGLGVKQDLAYAARLYRKSADAGVRSSMLNLGVLYEDGEGVAKDYAEAVKWYRKAAEREWFPAMQNLGRMYLYGRGVPKDDVEAIKWFQKAADGGEPNAMSTLGRMYELGRGGLPMDEAKAIEWYKKGADAGDEYGKNQLKRLGKE